MIDRIKYFKYLPAILIVAVGFFFFMPTTHAAISFVQSTSTATTGATHESKAFKNNVAKGDLLVVGATADPGSIATATDTLNDTFVLVSSSTPPGNDFSTFMFVATTTAAGADTVTVSANSTNNVYYFSIAEYSGTLISSVSNMIDASSSAVSVAYPGSTAPNSGSITTSNANDLVVGFFGTGNNAAGNTFTDNAHYTKRELTSAICPGGTVSQCINLMDWITTSTVTTAATSTLGISDDWTATVVAFNASGTTGGGVPGAPGTPTYSNISTSTVTVNWSSVGGVSYYNIDRSASANGTYSQIGTTTSLLYNDSGLTTSATYWYEVAATNASGTGSFSATSSVTTVPIFLVQSASSSAEDSANYFTTASAQFTQNTTAGNTIIVLEQYGDDGTILEPNDGEDDPAGCIDSTGADNYQEAFSVFNFAEDEGEALYYATDIAGGTTPTVTCGFGNSGAGYISLAIHEYYGLATSSASVLDTTVTNDYAGSATGSMQTGTTTPSTSGDLIFGGLTEVNHGPGDTCSAQGSFTARVNQCAAAGLITEDMIQSSAGPISASASVSPSSAAYVGGIAAFRPFGNYGGGSATGTNISSAATSHWAWNDTIGWIDFYDTDNILVGSSKLTGYASSSAGYISLDCNTSPNGDICGTSNYEVTNNGSGDLSGWAWNDEYGWISFDCHNNSGCGTSNYEVTVSSSTGVFQGYAWNDAIGWIDFNCNQTPIGGSNACGTSNYDVQASWSAGSTAPGTLVSATFDTGDVKGAQLNSVLWQGTEPSNSTIQFQFAVSNSSSGPWNFTGPDDTSSTYYTPTGPGVSLPLNYSAYSGYRYFRYEIIMSASSTSPTINSVTVNWSP